MADVVQYRLERMVNELEDLESRGIFTRREIGEIVKQRRKFEYRLKRPSPLKQDYLAYIEYEKQVDSLRLLRRKAVGERLKKQGNKKMKKSVSDFAGVSRILEIYRLACMRYKGDVDLWLSYLQFCRQKRNGRMKKVLAQVIRFHPKVPGIWIYAASWEFDHNLNVSAARALMQSGLRVCPNSEDLWVEYLRMELTYLNKLKARKVAIGEDEGSLNRNNLNSNEKQWREENSDLFMSFSEGQKDDAFDAQHEESEKRLDVFRKQGSNILRTIYNCAIEALPSSLNLRKQFFEIVEALDLSQPEELRNEIHSNMKSDFLRDPEYWDWVARLGTCVANGRQEMSEEVMQTQLRKAFQVYEEALTILPSATMLTFYVKFLIDVSAIEGRKSQNIGLASPAVDSTTHLLSVYEKAESMGCLTEDFACQYVSYYLQLGKLDEARKLAEKLCSKHPKAMQLWVLRASIEMRYITRKSVSLCKADLLPIFDLLKTVLTKVPISDTESLWIMALKLFASQKHYFDKLVDISLVSLAKHGGGENGFCISSALVNFIFQRDGVQSARQMYKRFLALPHPGITLYKTCIELESNMAFTGNNDCLVNARKLFESALTIYGQDVSLWQDYYSMEIKMGTSETAATVYWRARKTLKNAAAFIASPDIRGFQPAKTDRLVHEAMTLINREMPQYL